MPYMAKVERARARPPVCERLCPPPTPSQMCSPRRGAPFSSLYVLRGLLRSGCAAAVPRRAREKAGRFPRTTGTVATRRRCSQPATPRRCGDATRSTSCSGLLQACAVALQGAEPSTQAGRRRWRRRRYAPREAGESPVGCALLRSTRLLKELFSNFRVKAPETRRCRRCCPACCPARPSRPPRPRPAHAQRPANRHRHTNPATHSRRVRGRSAVGKSRPAHEARAVQQQPPPRHRHSRGSGSHEQQSTSGSSLSEMRPPISQRHYTNAATGTARLPVPFLDSATPRHAWVAWASTTCFISIATGPNPRPESMGLSASWGQAVIKSAG